METVPTLARNVFIQELITFLLQNKVFLFLLKGEKQARYISYLD